MGRGTSLDVSIPFNLEEEAARLTFRSQSIELGLTLKSPTQHDLPKSTWALLNL